MVIVAVVAGIIGVMDSDGSGYCLCRRIFLWSYGIRLWSLLSTNAVCGLYNHVDRYGSLLLVVDTNIIRNPAMDSIMHIVFRL